MADDFYYVRLKPYQPSKNHLLRKYILHNEKMTFLEEKGWYKVPRRIAAKLQSVTQRTHDPDSPNAFEIVPAKVREEQQRQARRKAAEELVYGDAPPDYHEEDREPKGRGDLTLDDLPIMEDIPEDEVDPNAPKELGVSMADKKDRLLEIADALGLSVDSTSTKKQIFEAIKAEVSE